MMVENWGVLLLRQANSIEAVALLVRELSFQRSEIRFIVKKWGEICLASNRMNVPFGVLSLFSKVAVLLSESLLRGE